MKKLKFNALFILLVPMGLLMASCEKDDPVPEVDQEVITDVTLTFTEVDEADQPVEGTAIVAVASDVQGIGLGNSLEIDVISSLGAGKKYQLDISLFNSIAGEDVTEEVAEDDTEHQFYFLGSAFVGDGAFLAYDYGDADSNGKPLGLKGFVTVDESTTANSGTFRLVLRHDLDKDYTGADNPHFGNFEQAGGESDLDVDFQVTL